MDTGKRHIDTGTDIGIIIGAGINVGVGINIGTN